MAGADAPREPESGRLAESGPGVVEERVRPRRTRQAALGSGGLRCLGCAGRREAWLWPWFASVRVRETRHWRVGVLEALHSLSALVEC